VALSRNQFPRPRSALLSRICWFGWCAGAAIKIRNERDAGQRWQPKGKQAVSKDNNYGAVFGTLSRQGRNRFEIYLPLARLSLCGMSH
jgi:hypothetical protein